MNNTDDPGPRPNSTPTQGPDADDAMVDASSTVLAEIERLRSPDARARFDAARELQGLGSRAEPAIPWLIRTLDDDRPIKIEMIIEGTGDPRSGELPGDQTVAIDSTPGDEAIATLVSIGPASVDPLIGCLDDPRGSVRTRAIKGLTRLRDPRAIGPLIGLLKNNDDPGVRRALIRIGRTQIEAMSSHLADPDPTVRTAVIGVLGQTRDPRAIPPVTAMLEDDHERVRLATAEALKNLTSPVSHVLPIDALHDDDPEERARAVQRMGVPGQDNDPGVVDQLIDAYGDPDPEVREQVEVALIGLGKQTADRIITILNTQLQNTPPPGSPDIERICLLTRVLGEISDPAGVGSLATCLASDHEDVVWFAAEALGKIATPGAMRVLIDTLRDGTTPWQRSRSAKALGSIQDPLAHLALTDALNDPDDEVRQEAISVLKEQDLPPHESVESGPAE